LIKLTHHLDKLENTYNLLHKEYSDRIKIKWMEIKTYFKDL
jgi:hypothetical protein